MAAKTKLYLMQRRILENQFFVHAGLIPLGALGALCATIGLRRRAVSLLSQVHRTARVPLVRRMVEPYVFANRDVAYRAERVGQNQDVSRHFGKRISVLKEPGTDGERGVLFVMFSEMLSLVFATIDVRRLAKDFTIVAEPSWSGYCDEVFLRFTQLEEDVFVLAAQQDDYDFLQRLHSNLIPVDLGPCDWVDPRVAEPYVNNRKEFDIVMNSHWGSWKRHHVLFRMLRQAKRRYRVLLIGSSWTGTSVAEVLALADHFKVREQLTIVEDIPYEKVMDLTCRARVSVLLSLKEGSNRAIAESIFCNVPVIVLANHVGGIIKNVRPETGLLVKEEKLEGAIEELLDRDLRPREWGTENVSFLRSTEKLNAILRSHSLQRGRPWTRDIVARSNSPESTYAMPSDAKRLAPWNEGLSSYLLASLREKD
jgi:glycosyltransferase involved in cell wall biosynthesis